MYNDQMMSSFVIRFEKFKEWYYYYYDYYYELRLFNKSIYSDDDEK